MAKVPFSKLNAKISQEIKYVEVPNYDNQIEVIQYLPINDKLVLLEKVIYQAHDDNQNFSNPVKIKVYFTIELINAYTNITFTDKQKEDITKLYDMLISSGWWTQIESVLPKEVDILWDNLNETIDSIYKYRHSVLGIMDAVSQDYSDTTYDAELLQKTIGNKENLDLIRQILRQMG